MMKKIIMALSLAAMLAIPATALAQNAGNGKNTCKPAKCSQTSCNTPCNTNCNPGCNPCDSCTAACTPACANTPVCANGDNNGKACRKDFKGKHHGKKGHCKYSKKSMSQLDARNLPKGNPLMYGIELSADQQQKMQSFREQQKADRQKVKAEAASKNAKDREKRMAAYDKEMKKILTPEQYKQYEANKEAMKTRRDAQKARQSKGMARR